VLEAALARRAEFIVTGDRDLLDVGEFHGIKILTPREFELLFN
jgi:predicted nucleic acid-binding protein